MPTLKESWVDQISYGGGKASYTQPWFIEILMTSLTRSTAAGHDGTRPMGQFILCQVLFLPCSPSCGLCIPLLRLWYVRMPKLHLWPKGCWEKANSLFGPSTDWTPWRWHGSLGNGPPGNGGLQRIQLGRPSQAPVQASHSHHAEASRAGPVPMGVAEPAVLSFPVQDPQTHQLPAYGKEWTFVEPETLQSWFHVILTASLHVGTRRSLWTSYKTLNKLLNHPCLHFLMCEH